MFLFFFNPLCPIVIKNLGSWCQIIAKPSQKAFKWSVFGTECESEQAFDKHCERKPDLKAVRKTHHHYCMGFFSH